MARNEDKNGYSIPAPKSIYDKAYVVGNGLSKKSGDVTGLGWHPSGGIPEPRRYFGNSAGCHNSVSENEQAKTLGNKWRRK